MKRFLVVGLVCLSTTALLGGCDFLEKEPLGQATSETFFETEQQAVAATNATYNMLRDWSVHVFAWLGVTDIVSEQATKGSTPSDASFLLELDNLDFDPGNIAFSTTWEGYYQGIYRANVAINNLPNVEMDEGLRERLVAENKFLRAYFYFFLVRVYGGVPLITEPLEPGNFEQPRASAEEVYSFIEQDLQEAIEVLPLQSEYPAEEWGRATQGAAQGLLAKVHLFQEEYQEALQHAEVVINSGEYALYPDYSFIFREEGEFSSESVFEIQSIALEEGGGATQYAQVQGVRGVPNLGWGFNQPSDQLEASYEAGDPRQQATILYPWEQVPDGSGEIVHINPTIPNQRYNENVQPPVDTPGGTGNSTVNIRRLRYADVLLIAAEAAYRTGSEEQARTYLNQVRERARGDQTATLGLAVERLDDQLATANLGLSAGDSRVFVRHVNEEGPAQEEGLQSFSSEYLEQEGDRVPALINNIDVIEAIDGNKVTTPEEYAAVMQSIDPGETVIVRVQRITQQEEGGEVTTDRETRQFAVEAVELLPDVTASGEALLQAIWQERGVELAMEQHRWFDLIRQGRAEEVMAAAGKNFQERHELYPIPQNEVDLAELEQNPGY